MAGGGNKNPMTEGTAPVKTYDHETWTAPAVGELTVPPAPVVYAVPTVGGVNTGIPQGGYANPAIEAYMAGTNVPTLSYVPGQHDAWLGTVTEDANIRAANMMQQAGGVPIPGAAQKADGSHLTQDYFDKQVNTIREETGWADYDPRIHAFDSDEGQQYLDAYKKSDAAQEAADTLYSNQVGIGAGNSLESGKYSGVSLADTLHSGLETVGQFSPLVGVANNVVSDYRAPADDNRSDSAGPRTAMEIAIDRQTKAYADSGKKFDMNDPSTWATSDSSDGGGTGGGAPDDDDCVIATFAASTGVDIGKRDAVQWCMTTLHGNFIGETIRTGYQKLGRKKINAGKAVEHFEEFKRYIDYARGERKDLRAALTFYGRSIQFFVVGLLEK